MTEFRFIVTIGVLLLGVLTVLLPVLAYCAQKWAHKCFIELHRMNALLQSQARVKHHGDK